MAVPDSKFQDFCDTKCIRCEVKESELPLYFVVRQDAYSIDCEAVSEYLYYPNAYYPNLVQGDIWDTPS